MDDSLATRFQQALINVNDSTTAEVDGEVVRVLRRAEVDGFEVVQNSDFDNVRAMAKRTNMPPYQRY